MEILIHAQFENTELAISRLNTSRRRYQKYLLQTSEDRVLTYLKLVEKYLLKPHVISDNDYREQVSNQVIEEKNQDIFTLCFIAWLMARWQKKTTYQVVLSLIHEHTISKKSDSLRF